MTDFNYSRGWLTRFKSRHCISSHRIHGESGSVSASAVTTSQEQLRTALAGYPPDDIYNFDETGFFYKLGPSSTLASGPAVGKKRSKDRVTVGLMCNASGTDKVKPIVIGKAKRPRCFGKTFDPSIYCTYVANKNAWMTSNIFRGFLQKFDRTLRIRGRNVIVLVDNASCHSISGDEFSNLKLFFLPPNMTAKIQPLDAGIIRATKAHYRAALVRHYLQCAEKDEPQTVTLRWCIRALRMAWDAVGPTTVVNCWRHVGILPPEDGDKNDDPMDDLPLARLQQCLREAGATEPEAAAEQFLAIDDEAELEEELTDEAILEVVGQIPSDPEDVASVCSDPAVGDLSSAKPMVTSAMAQAGLETALQFFEDIGDEQQALRVADVLLSLNRCATKYTSRQALIRDFFQ